MQHRAPWRIVWPSLVGHLLIAAVLLKALPPAAVGVGTSETIDVVVVSDPETSPDPVNTVAAAGLVRTPPGGRSLALRRSLTEASLVDHHRHSAPRSGSPPGGVRTNPAAVSSNDHSQSNPIIARILARLRRASRYPAEARRHRLTGRPVVEFTIRRDGTTTAARIITSSGIAILDAAALEAIRRAEPFPYFPDPFPVLINYQLP